jgi:hypothetical protein
MAGSVTIQGQLTGTTSGTIQVGPFTLVPNAAGNFQADEYTLASGANTITVPSWALYCVMVPSPLNDIALTLKGVSGDTGIPVSESQPNVITFGDTPPANIVVTAASLTTTTTTFLFT